MNYNISIETTEKRIIDNAFAKGKKDKKIEKVFSNSIMVFNIISEASLTAAELISKISEKADMQVRSEIISRTLYSRSFSKGEEVKKVYADSDVVEEENIRYSAEVKAD